MPIIQPVAKVTENDTAERTEKESDAKGGKCGERSHRRAYLREKLAIKHQCGGDAIE
jgi:hypothetical protein